MIAVAIVIATYGRSVFPSAVGQVFTIDPEIRSPGAARPLRIDAASVGRGALAEHPPP
jgi:hypothetical protein